MEPVYMLENRYSYLVGSYRPPLSASYVVQDAEGEFEQNLQDLYLKGQEHLHHEEYTLALGAFQEASGWSAVAAPSPGRWCTAPCGRRSGRPAA